MRQIAVVLLLAGVVQAQGQAPRSFVGTIAGFRPEKAQIEIRPDNGDPVIAEISPESTALKVAPGTRDLKGAEAIPITDVTVGDRVLVTLAPGAQTIARIVVMPAREIALRNDADRSDWEKRGVSGIVSGKSGNRITVKTRTATGETEVLVAVDDETAFKRYAPDSVKFADAKPSKLPAVSVGDQLRARGEKSEDGLKVAAREVVFGTFVVKAGTVVAVDPESRQVTIKELGTNKPLTVVLTAGSQMKQMPSFPAGMGAPGRGSAARVPAGRGMGSRGFDINEMLERMPAATLSDLKPGSTLVVSSTKGENANHLTAIMVLANADMLIQMASMVSNNGRGRGDVGPGMGPGMGGMQGGDFGGLGLSGIIMQ